MTISPFQAQVLATQHRPHADAGTVWVAQLQDCDDTTRELDWVMIATSETDVERLLADRAATELRGRYGPNALDDPAEMIPTCPEDDLDPGTAGPLELWCSATGAKYDITQVPLPDRGASAGGHC